MVKRPLGLAQPLTIRRVDREDDQPKSEDGASTRDDPPSPRSSEDMKLLNQQEDSMKDTRANRDVAKNPDNAQEVYRAAAMKYQGKGVTKQDFECMSNLAASVFYDIPK